MNNVVIDLNGYKSVRKKVRFSYTQGRYKYGGRNCAFPIICLRDIETKIVLWYSHYEMYISNLRDSWLLGWSTLRKKASAICLFLNYLLYETTIENVNDCSLSDIQAFFEYMKVCPKTGEQYSEETWWDYRNIVLAFLENYYLENSDKVQFNYKGDELYKYIQVGGVHNEKKYVVKVTEGLSNKKPESKGKKNRFLVREYLDLLLFEAQKYDPEIVLAIMLQAYAGLREGEVVNLVYGKECICFVEKGFGRLSNIIININNEADHIIMMNTKTDPGTIKRHRNKQEVYYDFLEKVRKQYNNHQAMKVAKGESVKDGEPIFTNTYGKPLTVFTYRNRLKELFYKHFLPDLKKTCELQGTWEENAPYIEAYEDEYPGAHALRHWFTMYLIEVARKPNGEHLSEGDIQAWRGDKNPHSMEEYRHFYSGILNTYIESVYVFQEWLVAVGASRYEQWKNEH